MWFLFGHIKDSRYLKNRKLHWMLKNPVAFAHSQYIWLSPSCSMQWQDNVHSVYHQDPAAQFTQPIWHPEWYLRNWDLALTIIHPHRKICWKTASAMQTLMWISQEITQSGSGTFKRNWNLFSMILTIAACIMNLQCTIPMQRFTCTNHTTGRVQPANCKSDLSICNNALF